MNAPSRTAPERRGDILGAATRAFATHGFRGASLRDIAREAGVSLTLLDHHFGSKASLLDAVVRSHHDLCMKRIEPLRDSVRDTPPSVTLDRFVAEWVRYEFALYASREQRHHLQLMLRLAVDDGIEAQLKALLNCSQAVVVRLLTGLRPRAPASAAEQGWTLASAALYAAVLSEHRRTDDQGLFEAATARFVAQGLKGIVEG